MPSCTCAPPRPRPAALVNREIRALAGRAVLSPGERAELAGLWAEWSRAVEAEAE